MNSSVNDTHLDIKLPTPPAIAMRILDAVQKEDASSEKLVEIITADPALASRILRVANSPFYALPAKVSGIQRALVVIGSKALKNIALSFVIADGLRSETEGEFDFDYFWKRSVTAAVSGDLIAALIGNKGDDVFVTSLLQDIGVVILHQAKPDQYQKVLDEKRTSGVSITAAENHVLGLDHQQVGMQVLKAWGLPPAIYTPVGSHHRPGIHDSGSGSDAGILNLADMLSSLYHGTHCSKKLQDVKEILSSRYHIDEARIDSMVDQVAEHSIQILSSFEIDPGDMKPFSLMLQEANEELGRLNLSYEQLVIELKKSKETAEKLAYDLQKANSRLREMAFRDGLTELFNHRFFQEFMIKEVSRANRHRHPFSLILFDLDHFKQFNDRYGHPAGDQMLKSMAASILNAVREGDVAARYGGEEFAVALPETDSRGALVLAERLRQKVASLKITIDGEKVGTTISIGVASWIPGGGAANKAAVIDAADKAMYRSKNNGRNRISYADPLKIK